jgi:hypothetical protein
MDKYYILVKYYYYSSTLYPRLDHPMIDWSSDKTLLFDTLESARKYLESQGIDILIKGKQTYTSSGRYVLEHGEYDRPDYQIRKVRSNNNG